MRRVFVVVVAVFGLLAAGCVTNPPPPDPGPQQCQPGTFSATGEEPCTPAPVGSYVDTVGATEATLCQFGTYQDQQGQASCIPASPGSFVDFEGAAFATLCPLGRYQPNSGSISCIIAQIGTYVDTLGADASTKCLPGKTTLGIGSTSASDCIDILAVAYSNKDAVNGFDPTSADVLIAELLDTSANGAPSAGDTVITHRYPLDLAATTFGFFSVTNHAVDTVVSAATPLMVGSGGNQFVFGIGTTSCGPFELYGEEAAGGSTYITDYTWCAQLNPTDGISVDQVSPSEPATPVSVSDSADLYADFIDIDFPNGAA